MTIFTGLIQNESLKDYITEYKEFNKESDPNGILGKDNQYTSKLSWDDKRLSDLEDDLYAAGSIEVFKNEKDATIRKAYFEYFNDKMLNTFSEDIYGKSATTMHALNKKVFQKGNAILIVNINFSEDIIDTYVEIFNKTINDYVFEQKDVPDNNTITKITDENNKSINEMINNAKVDWENELNALSTNLESRISTVKTSLNNEELIKIEGEIEEYNVPYFSEKYQVWKADIAEIRVSVDEHKKEEDEKAVEAFEQQTALKRAKEYLKTSAFSYNRLVEQLEYEGFRNQDAIYAADHCNADWNEQAAKKAKSYMNMSAFSRARLIEQLLYEKYTQEQAEYGASAVGY